MATYRDPLEAARLRVARARDRAAAEAARLSPPLIARLPQALRERLAELHPAAFAEASDVEGWRAVEAAIADFEAAIGEAIALVPAIDEEANRLPAEFPDRFEPAQPVTLDIYDERLIALRQRVHARLRALDPAVRLLDERPRYFDQVERPLLVEALLSVAGHPLRFQLDAFTTGQAGGPWTISFDLGARVRRSTPDLVIDSHWFGSLLALLRLKRDLKVGDERLDRELVFEVLAGDAARVLTPALRQALHALLDTSRPRIQVRQGLATVAWHERAPDGRSLPAAAAALLALRELEPLTLLFSTG